MYFHKEVLPRHLYFIKDIIKVKFEKDCDTYNSIFNRDDLFANKLFLSKNGYYSS
jgi:hypothetical protein